MTVHLNFQTWGKLHEKCMKCPKQCLVTVLWEEHHSLCIHAIQIKL